MIGTLHKSQEKFKTATHYNGVYSIATYLDDDRQPTIKSKATHFEIKEFNDQDKCVKRLYGKLLTSEEIANG